MRSAKPGRVDKLNFHFIVSKQQVFNTYHVVMIFRYLCILYIYKYMVNYKFEPRAENCSNHICECWNLVSVPVQNHIWAFWKLGPSWATVQHNWGLVYLHIGNPSTSQLGMFEPRIGNCSHFGMAKSGTWEWGYFSGASSSFGLGLILLW